MSATWLNHVYLYLNRIVRSTVNSTRLFVQRTLRYSAKGKYNASGRNITKNSISNVKVSYRRARQLKLIKLIWEYFSLEKRLTNMHEK